MDITDLFMILFYGVATFFVIFLFSSLLRKPHPPAPSQVIVVEERPIVHSWWPWNTTPYNAWPYWTGWWSGGYNGGYYPRRWRDERVHPLRPLSTRPWGGHGRYANSGGFSKPSPKH